MLNSTDQSHFKVGTVYLVGAGPGDPGLLTRRALQLIQTCEIIAYDALISPTILTFCSPSAELISVGYRGYGSQQLGYRMHPRIIEAALAGKSVVRLKSGDPLVFGRAGQECEELSENGIPFEIVPGITAAVAAAAYLGIPLTHRDHSSDIVITSGHDLRGGSASNSNWEALGKSTGTIAVYMAGSKIQENCQRLIEMGRSANTPAAFVTNATRGSQKVFISTLSKLSESVGSVEKGVPALVIAGETVGLNRPLEWFGKQLFHNLTVLVVRARRGPSKISEHLRRHGADVLEAPWIQISQGRSSLDVTINVKTDEEIENLVLYRNLIFSCEDGIEPFFKRLLKSGRDLRKLRELRLIAMGEKISARLACFAVLPDLVLDGHCSKAILDKKEILREGRSLVITSNRGRPTLKKTLLDLGIFADFLSTYSIHHTFPEIVAPQVDYVVLPSSTSAQLLFEGPWGEALRQIPMIALGPETSAGARRLGADHVLMTAEDSPESVVALLSELLPRPKGKANGNPT